MGAWNVTIKKYLPDSSLPKVDFFCHFSQVHPVSLWGQLGGLTGGLSQNLFLPKIA